MANRIPTSVLILTAMSLFKVHLLAAAEIETLLMPGAVISGHADYEAECSKCHVRFSKSTQTRLCLDCHETVDSDIQSGQGFHGQSPDVKDRPCKECHTDHAGRDADIVLLDQATFDHHYTDFSVEGAHVGVSCMRCHQPGNKYAEAPTACFDCHRKQDQHKGSLGEICSDCHVSTGWKRVVFDHGSTEFALQGKHRKVACNSCHLNEKYRDTPKKCNACHSLNDIHAGRNGIQCEDCHSTQNWDQSRFNHDRETDFPLRGKHAKVACEACHTQALAKEKPKTDCYSCHRNDDSHRGRYGHKCGTCHRVSGWGNSRFDHSRDTDFPLRGTHAKLLCSACHRGEIHTEELSSQCYSCHKGDDVHHGQEGKICSDCHQEKGWSSEVLFEHDLSRFPLLGLHASTPCEECHISSAFKDTDTECHDCHQQDDVHQSGLGNDCKQCHNPNSWALWIFDHDEQTDFVIDGAHQDLSCEDCHIKPVDTQVRQSNRCHSCHKQDDIHQGRFGHYCERCHNTKSFLDVSIRR